MKQLFPILLTFCLIACSESEEPHKSFFVCNQVTDKYKTYNGEDIECQFHYVLTEYNQEQFIELISHCADLTRPYVIDKNCVDICEVQPYDENSVCSKYLKERKTIEILLIEK